jgi:hypothetical protein
MVYFMPSKRIEKIKNARSINDVLDVVKEIAYEFKNSSAIVKKLVVSLSNELVFDYRERKPAKGSKIEFIAPPVAELKKHVDVIDKLYDNLIELNAAEAKIKQAFAGNKKLPEALRALKELKQNVTDSVEDAFSALSGIADKHVPTRLNSLADVLTSHVIEVISSSNYKNIFPQLYVAPDVKEKNLFHFCYYIGIENLKDQSGYIYEVYYIVITAVITTQGVMKLYVNGLPDFAAPGKYPLGAEVDTNPNAKKRVDFLLSHNHFVTEHERLALPVTNERAQTSGIKNIRGVTGVDVVEDEFIVYVDNTITTANVQKVITEVMANLNTLVSARKRDTVFKYATVKRKGKKAIVFILTPGIAKKQNMSQTQLTEVSELLGLSDKQVKALKFALQNKE